MVRALLLLLTCAGGLQAAKINVNFYEKKIYYKNSPIQLHVVVHNDSSQVYFLRLADKKIFNIELDVTKLNEEPLSPSPIYTSTMGSNRPQFYRDISLGPDEEYGFIVSLKDFVEIPEPGLYLLQARYTMNTNLPLVSNKIFLNIRPGDERLEPRDQQEEKTLELLRKDDLSPDAVVDTLLTSLQNQHWQRFALYLDIESMLEHAPSFRYRFRAASLSKRDLIKREFLQDLQQEKVAEVRALVRVPDDYTIIQTNYSQAQAQVEVLQTFNSQGFYRKVRYLYYLNRTEGYWRVYDYQTLSLKE